MRNLLVTLWLLTGAICCVLPNVAHARASAAAIGVSVTVVSACSVTATPLAGKPVGVSCSYNTPYSVAQTHGTVADLLAGAAAVSYSHLSAPAASSNVTITTVTY
jgi:hypothetical protein